jgi:hypothetical protein
MGNSSNPLLANTFTSRSAYKHMGGKIDKSIIYLDYMLHLLTPKRTQAGLRRINVASAMVDI